MKKTKKFLSLLLSLAMTASVFAGMVIPASASETQIGTTYTFEEASLDDVWSSAQNQLKITAVQDDLLGSKVLYANVSGSGGRSGTIKLPSVVTASGNNPVRVEFDWFSATTVGACRAETIIVDSSNKQILSLSEPTNSNISVNGNETELKSGWYKVSATLDFETHRIINVKLTPNGAVSSAAEFNDMPFVDSASSDVAGLFINGVRASGSTLTVNVRIDNFAAYSVENEYHKVVISVKDSSGTAVNDAKVTLNGVEYKTGANGQIETKLANGSYNYIVEKAGYEATEGASDPATGTVNVADADVTENVTYSKQSYTPTPDQVTLFGGQNAMTAPRTKDSVSSAAFSVEAVDQKGVMITDPTVTWSIEPYNEKVNIAKGIVTVAKGFNAGENHVTEFTVKANVEKNNSSKEVSAKLAVSDYLFYEPGEGASSYGEAEIHTVGGGDYITTGSTKNQENVITFIDPVTFAAGTAQELSFETSMNTKVYTFQRSVILTDSKDTQIASVDYVNLDMGTNTEWSSKDSKLGTVWGAIPDVNQWQTVKILFRTNAQGVTKAILTIGDSETDLGALTVSDLAKIKLKVGDCGGGTDRYVAVRNIIVKDIDVTGMGVSGAKEISSIQGVTRTKEYAADVMILEDNETFTWTTDIDGATLTPSKDTMTAILSVPDTVTSGGSITVTSSASTAEKPKTASIDVNIESVQITSADVKGAETIDIGNTSPSKYTVSNVIDQFGEDISKYVKPVWSIDGVDEPEASVTFDVDSDNLAVVVKAMYNSDGTLAGVTAEPMQITAGENIIEAPHGAKVMLWNSLAGMVPYGAPKVAEADTTGVVAVIDSSTGLLSAFNTGSITVIATIAGQDFEYPVRVDKYTLILTDDDITSEIDVSGLINYGSEEYTVTKKTASGVTSEVAMAAGNTVDIGNTTGVTKVEISPVYKFDLGGSEIGYTGVSVSDIYDSSIGYGMTADVNAATAGGTGVQSTGVTLADKTFKVSIPNGRYDVTVYKADTARADIIMNGSKIITYMDFMDDKTGRQELVTEPGVMTKRDVVVTDGIAEISMNGRTTAISGIEFRKISDDIQRKTHIWIAGDSTVCNYYPLPSSKDDWAAGTRRTGWGQLLTNYVSDDVIVDNFAYSGDWADQWSKNTFPSVIDNAEAGDYLIIQFGINDRTRTPDTAVMKAALVKMVDEARAKGVIPVLQTPEICISQYGTGTPDEHGVSTGSGHGTYFDVVREVAKEKGTLFIDLADISGKEWGTLGQTWVKRNYFLWDSASDAQEDAQHMSYIGAKRVAQMVANAIADAKAAGTASSKGETFENIPVNDKTTTTTNYLDYADNQAEKTLEITEPEFVPSVRD